MSVNGKKIFSTIVYYTLVALAILFAAFFVFALSVKDVAMWARIIYYIWAGLVIANVIFDIICTNTHEAKQISGLITYVLSLLAVIMAVILYVINSGRAGLADSFFNLFVSISIISLITTGFMISSWCVGENLVSASTAENEIQKQQNKRA